MSFSADSELLNGKMSVLIITVSILNHLFKMNVLKIQCTALQKTLQKCWNMVRSHFYGSLGAYVFFMYFHLKSNLKKRPLIFLSHLDCPVGAYTNLRPKKALVYVCYTSKLIYIYGMFGFSLMNVNRKLQVFLTTDVHTDTNGTFQSCPKRQQVHYELSICLHYARWWPPNITDNSCSLSFLFQHYSIFYDMIVFPLPEKGLAVFHSICWGKLTALIHSGVKRVVHLKIPTDFL